MRPLASKIEQSPANTSEYKRRLLLLVFHPAGCARRTRRATCVREMRNSLLSWPSDQPALRNFIKLFAVEDLFGSAENLTFRSFSGQSCLGPENQTLPFLLGKTADDGNQYIPQHRYWTVAVEPRLSHGFILNVPAVQCVKEVQRLPRRSSICPKIARS